MPENSIAHFHRRRKNMRHKIYHLKFPKEKRGAAAQRLTVVFPQVDVVHIVIVEDEPRAVLMQGSGLNPGMIGTLAKDEVRQMRNRAIVVITLASRAAIRGGLLPEISFSMSDVFIQSIEAESDTAVLLNMMHQFEFRYAEMVADLNSQKAGRPRKDQNPRVDQCKDYIFRHLHEKIRIQDIADELYLNANYLSEIFHQHEGVTITEFILQEKVGLTKNLLTYSPYTYSEIAAYLGFSSQSHLGKTFRRLTGLTLKQYRDLYGVREFRIKKAGL